MEAHKLQLKGKQEYRLGNYRIMEFRNSFRLKMIGGDFQTTYKNIMQIIFQLGPEVNHSR